MRFKYDIIVVGAGHAGCEAAVAAARMGCTVLLVTMDMGKVAQMSCNPAIGGVAKGQIVREIDALGGQMGLVADRTGLQFRMLNRSKGAAMWSPRMQCDKYEFSVAWREILDSTSGLFMWQDTVSSLLFEAAVDSNTALVNSHTADGRAYTEGQKICGVRTRMGVEFRAECVILTAGTFLNGLMHVGQSQMSGGRAGDMNSTGVSEQLAELGFEVARMKTGTPARLDGRTIDFSKLERQDGDALAERFSYLSSSKVLTEQLPCYIATTTAEVHDILRTGFDRSPLFTGVIRGIGPRYCPSIEDKLRTFADKEQHQLFLEPEGRTTNEYYLNGFSSSLPLEVQVEALQRIAGFENVQIYRPGYAIEYDYFPPTQLHHSLETKLVQGLFFAGQVNGTTGYEEAGAQGLMAGINAVLRVREGATYEPFVLGRNEGYIGVLIDDLVTKGVDEPYRMFTSRAEYRILLRQDNADMRLTERSYGLGLADAVRYGEMCAKREKSEALVAFLSKNSVSPDEVNGYFEANGGTLLSQKRRMNEVLMRNDVTLELLEGLVPALREWVTDNCIEVQNKVSAEILIKYSGYIEREMQSAEKLKRLEHIKIPEHFDYASLTSLSIESRQKLGRIRPHTIAQASRIPGVSPADINVLLVYFGR